MKAKLTIVLLIGMLIGSLLGGIIVPAIADARYEGAYYLKKMTSYLGNISDHLDGTHVLLDDIANNVRTISDNTTVIKREKE